MEESAEKEQRKLTLTDKFAREKERKDISDWKTIYLYREGTFLRAFNVTAQHKANISKLGTLEDVIGYDYTTRYPQKLVF